MLGKTLSLKSTQKLWFQDNEMERKSQIQTQKNTFLCDRTGPSVTTDTQWLMVTIKPTKDFMSRSSSKNPRIQAIFQDSELPFVLSHHPWPCPNDLSSGLQSLGKRLKQTSFGCEWWL